MRPEGKRACDCCNIRKIKCDGGNPCARCVASGVTCTSIRQRKKSGPRNLRQSKTKILKQQSATFASAFWQPDDEPRPSSLPSSSSDCSPPLTAFGLDDQSLWACPVLPEPPWNLHRIALPVLEAVLMLYNEKLYGIWPLVRVDDLLLRLEADPTDAELYALASALCAATLSYLDSTISHEILTEPMGAEAFVTESRRVRGTFDYMEPVGINTILTSYFLHMHYGRRPLRAQMAAFYIREAITFAHILGLHNESSYAFPPWTVHERAVMRRLYFLLFMTERYLCIDQGLPTVLESISLPDVQEDDEQYPEVVGSFVNLVALFSTPGRSFFGMWTSNAGDKSISREQLLLIQRAIQRPMMDGGSNYSTGAHVQHDPLYQSNGRDDMRVPSRDNPIQLVDIVVTQHWIRSLAWKLSVLRGYVSPKVTATGPLSVAYPIEIATDTLRSIQKFPKHAFESHGPGMEVKMCEIATALADSILCSPVAAAAAATLSGARQSRDTAAKMVLQGLADRIFEAQTMNPSLKDGLATKIETLLKCSNLGPSISEYQELEDEEEFISAA